MPIPKPNAGEDHGTFISRCMGDKVMNDDYPEQTQRAAVCYASWRKKPKEADELIKKEIDIKNLDDDTFVVIATDSSVDRDGDIVVPEGVDVKNFMANGSFLYGHNRDMLPVARPLEAKIVNGQLMIKGQWAEKGTHDFCDAVRSLVKQDMLKGVSIGFLGKDSEENKDADGHRIGRKYTKSELVETSFTPIPSNANARVVAKDFPAEVQKALFAEKGDDEQLAEDAKEIETIFKDVCLSLHIDVGADGSISQIHGSQDTDDGGDGMAPFDPSSYSTPEEGMSALLDYARKYLKLPDAQHEAEDAEAAEAEAKVKELLSKVESAAKG